MEYAHQWTDNVAENKFGNKVKRTLINDTHYESFTLSINQVNSRRNSVLITKLVSILGTLFIAIYNRGVFGDSSSS